MPNWKSTINVSDLFDAARDKSMTVNEIGKALSARLKLNTFIKQAIAEADFNVMDMLDQFENVTDTEDFDYTLSHLYDFADYGQRIWITTK